MVVTGGMKQARPQPTNESVKISVKLKARLEAVSAKTGLPQKTLMERAVTAFLDKIEKSGLTIPATAG